MPANSDPEAILIENDDEIITHLERIFGSNNDDYFILNQQMLKNQKTGNSFILVHVQIGEDKYKTISFRKI